MRVPASARAEEPKVDPPDRQLPTPYLSLCFRRRVVAEPADPQRVSGDRDRPPQPPPFDSSRLVPVTEPVLIEDDLEAPDELVRILGLGGREIMERVRDVGGRERRPVLPLEAYDLADLTEGVLLVGGELIAGRDLALACQHPRDNARAVARGNQIGPRNTDVEIAAEDTRSLLRVRPGVGRAVAIHPCLLLAQVRQLQARE